jgi:hypothetical protein
MWGFECGKIHSSLSIPPILICLDSFSILLLLFPHKIDAKVRREGEMTAMACPRLFRLNHTLQVA